MSLFRSWFYLAFRTVWRIQERIFGKGVVNVWLLRMDRLAQDKWFGGKFETISGHLGRVQLRYGGKIPWSKRPLQAFVSRFLDWLDPGHCKKSIGY